MSSSEIQLDSAHRPKRRRVNFACNYCRGRKTRCDEQQPSCHACIMAGVPCVTEDPRRPGQQIKRREAHQSPSKQPTTTTVSPTVNSGRIGERAGGLHQPDPLVTPTSPAEVVTATFVDRRERVPLVPTISDHRPIPFTGPLPMLLEASGTTCLEILTNWLDLALFRLGKADRFGLPQSQRDDGQSPSLIPLSFELPDLPEPDICRDLLGIYLKRLNSVFPILEDELAQQETAELLQSGPNHFLQSWGMISLLRVYLAFAAGALCDQDINLKPLIDSCLQLSRSYIGHIIGAVSLEALQTLILLSICLRYNDEISASMAILAMCVSMATTMGLNKPGAARSRRTSNGDKRIGHRLWLTLFCYENLFSFELGRASCIIDDHCYFPKWEDVGLGESQDSRLLEMVFGLARLLNNVGRRCIRVNLYEEQIGKDRVEEAISEKVKVTNETCRDVLQWAGSLPPDMRPDSDLISGSTDFDFISFMSIQYNNALIMLTRNSLLISKEAVQRAAEMIAKDTPWDFLTRHGQPIATNSARRILRIMVEADDNGWVPHFTTYYAPLHALHILAVYFLRQPESRMARLDFELMSNAMELIKKRSQLNARFDRLEASLRKLDNLVRQALEYPKTNRLHPANPDSSPNLRRVCASAGVEERLQNTPLIQSTTSALTSIMHQGRQQEGSEFQLDDASIALQDTEWSTRVPDEIGCDWADFLHVFTDFESAERGMNVQ